VAASHQLSPYLVAGSVVVLVLARLVRPWWLALAVPGVVIAYLVPRYSAVSGSFNIFDGLNIFSNAQGTAQGWGSVGQAVSAVTVRALTLLVWGLVALVAWRARRRLGSVAIPLILAVVPAGLLLAQNYGGEAIYRVYLFSAPWCAFLLAGLFVHLGQSSRRVARLPRPAVVAVLTVGLALMLGASIQGRHGQLLVDQQSPDDLAAARYLYAHGQPGATVVLATPSFPSRVAANYDQFNRSVPVGEPDLVTGAHLTGILDGDSIGAIQSFADSFDGTTTYLVVSDAMRRQARYFGYLPDGSLDALEATLAQDPQWSVFYRGAGVIIYQSVAVP
jgi:hypothetical protein